jgi:hypothetical protein
MQHYKKRLYEPVSSPAEKMVSALWPAGGRDGKASCVVDINLASQVYKWLASSKWRRLWRDTPLKLGDREARPFDPAYQQPRLARMMNDVDLKVPRTTRDFLLDVALYAIAQRRTERE